MTDDLPDLSAWIGNTMTAEDEVAAFPIDALNATFDRDEAPARRGDSVPPGWHCLYFHEVVPLSETGPDGHPAKGGFMPPVTLPRRMWAGTKMTFLQPLRVGERLRRVSTIADIAEKEGAGGSLVFVTQRHEFSGEDGLATIEEQMTAYRAEPRPDAPAPALRAAPEGAVWRRTIDPTPVMLFRFSALTMNSHRIHYDLEYTRGSEGYPGLLVHGPLTALLLLDLFRREWPDTALGSVSLRALAPLFGNAQYTVEGAPGEDGESARMWALTPEGGLAMSAEASVAA